MCSHCLAPVRGHKRYGDNSVECVWLLCSCFWTSNAINNSINSICFRTELFDLKSQSYLLSRMILQKECTISHIDTSQFFLTSFRTPITSVFSGLLVAHSGYFCLSAPKLWEKWWGHLWVFECILSRCYTNGGDTQTLINCYNQIHLNFLYSEVVGILKRFSHTLQVSLALEPTCTCAPTSHQVKLLLLNIWVLFFRHPK